MAILAAVGGLTAASAPAAPPPGVECGLPYVYNNHEYVDLPGSAFASLENLVYRLCEDAPSGGCLSVYDGSYALASGSDDDPNTAEQAVIQGMNECVG